MADITGMRALLQRVSRASVTVEGRVTGAIDHGLLVLAGVKAGDAAEDVAWLARKIVDLRIFPDGAGRMNRSVLEAGGKVLLVSQFTLHADVRRGRRPSFVAAAPPEEAVPRLDELQAALEAAGVEVHTGEFGAHMDVELLNDGPVTILLDSEERSRGGGPATAGKAVAGEAPAGQAEARESSDPGRFRLLAPGSPLETVPLVLASASPRRRDLLRDLGLAFTVHAADVDERKDVPDDPERHAAVLAERKARVVAAKFHECVVLAADTIVVLGDRILGKPGDEDEAFEMLRSLAGREHRVLTAVCVGHAARARFETRVVSTSVRFRPVDDEELRRYVSSGEPMGKAGAYAIQGRGGLLVAGIEGDYSNVVGLPLGATLDLLEDTVGLGAGA